MPLQVKVTGTWRNTNRAYTQISGKWHSLLNVFTRIAGTWRGVWSYSWQEGAWGSCSVTCGGGTQTRSVWCQRSDGVSVEDAFCDAGSKPTASQNCNTQACTDCRYSKSRPIYCVLHSTNTTDYSFRWESKLIGICNNCTSTYINGCKYWRGELQEQIFESSESSTWYTNYYTICRCCPSC